MAFKIKSTLEAIQGHLSAGGYLNRTQISEPKNAPVDMAAAVFLNNASLIRHMGTLSTELHVVTVRLYMDMLHEPQQDIEFRLNEAVAELTDDFWADYTLNGTIQEIDFAGKHGTALSVTYGYTDISGKIFRVADITLPLELTNTTTVAA